MSTTAAASRDTRIVPLSAGTLRRARSSQVFGSGPDEIELSCTMFYVRVDNRHVIVDTGIHAEEDARPDHRPLSRTPAQNPVAALAGIGVDPAEVEIVINTHLHWDHCSGNHHFPHATAYAQRSELHYAIAPLAMHLSPYEPVETENGRCCFVPTFLRSALTLLDGDTTLSENLRILHTPGHTPGSQSVLVRGRSATYLLPGDNVPLYENLADGDVDHFTPNGYHTDLLAYIASIRRSTAEADVVLPSHDSRVFDQAEYR